MEHGLFDKGESWMDRSDEEAACLPVQLFEKGFDVWINNARGTKAS